jgi:hypothetical protein
VNLGSGAAAWHWALGGLVIAAVTVAMLFLTNRRLGISGSFENLCSFIVRVPYLTREDVASSHAWRLPFLAGLVAGGFLSAASTTGWSPTILIPYLDQNLGLGVAPKLLWMFGGGVLIGVGTRMAGGCTSGHGIFGVARFEKSGLLSTLSFMAAGAITTNLIYRVLS